MQPWGSINFLGFQATHCGLFRRKIGENYRIFGRFFAENDQSAPKICRLGLYSRWGCIHADTVIPVFSLVKIIMKTIICSLTFWKVHGRFFKVILGKSLGKLCEVSSPALLQSWAT